MGAILAYLFAGIIIGPFVLGFIKDPEVILHFSELGVVFLLFIIGLELAPNKIWKLRHSIFGLGLLQVFTTGALFFCVSRYLIGLSSGASFAIGFGLALSSTAFAIQILEENRQLNTTHGQGSFSILMFQDLAVVPILASLSLFVDSQSEGPNYLTFLKMLGGVAFVVFVGHFLIRHILRLVADSRTQEVFTAMSLLLVLGASLLIEAAGLSMGMGAFLAGVMLANSEYRHELEINLLPFKGLLLGLFFIAVGMSLNLDILKQNLHWVLLITIGFMCTKSFIIYGLGRIFKFPYESSRNMAFTVSQGGEFAFVLFSAAVAKQLLDPGTSSMLIATVILSMALTPFIFTINQKFIRSYSEISERPFEYEMDSEGTEVIIAGYGRFGQIVSRFLNSENIKFTILEHSAAQVESARKFGAKIYYGDASRRDIVEAAGGKNAQIFVLAIDDPAKSTETAKMVQKYFPNLKIIARVRNRKHAMDLLELGITSVHRETYLTSLEVAKEVLLEKGRNRESINKRLAKFRSHDEEILKKQLEYKNDEKLFLSYTNQANKQLQDILKADIDQNQ